MSPPTLPELPDGLGEVAAAVRVAGGDLNQAWRVELADGRRLFVKHRPGAPPEEYAAEAAGLAWLAQAGALRVPSVIGVSARALALAWVEPGRLSAAGEEELGRGLAALHAAGAPAFGGERPLRLGAVVLPNDPSDDWPTFYARQRLAPLVAAARARDALSAGGAAAVERVGERIADLAGPPEPPARLHGDLWAGNVLAGADGRPWLIDPAAHGGHREVDLAMLRLFGAPSPRTLAAYAEAAPLAAGHEERVGLWQLLPLLVHAVLFGGSYGASAERVARRYG
ncbi:MAG TPA: fructosamine kinase family protein [Capillimicrobium sp.]